MIHFQVDMQDLTQIEAALGMMKDKSAMVLKAAINNTAKQTVQLLVDEANKEYQFTQPAQVRKTLNIEKKATAKNLTALVTSKGRVNELYNFMVKPRKYIRGGGVPGGYGAHTKRGAAYQNIFLKQGAASGDKYRAFVVTYKSGHKTLAQRRPDRKMKSDPSKEFLKTLFAPSIPNILGDEQGVYGVVEPKMYDMLQQNIQTQILRFIK